MAREKKKTQKIMRPGKTARDRASGSTDRRLSNRDKRVSWQHDRDCNNRNFPKEACNGKRNRYVKT